MVRDLNRGRGKDKIMEMDGVEKIEIRAKALLVLCDLLAFMFHQMNQSSLSNVP